jgi:hypothetical protein
MSEPYLWPVLHPQIFDDRIVLVYPGGIVNAVYTIDEAKLAVNICQKANARRTKALWPDDCPYNRALQC